MILATKNLCTCKVMTLYMVIGKHTVWFFCPSLVLLRHSFTDCLFSDINWNTALKAGGWLLPLQDRPDIWMQLLPVMTKTSRVLEEAGLVVGCVPVWRDSILKMDCKADESGVLSESTELEGSAVGKAAIGDVYLRSRKCSFFSKQLLCTVFANLDHTIWWLLAPSGVGRGIVITVLNVVVCWIFFLPIDREERVNQFLVTREKILLQSKGFVCSVEEGRHFACVLALTYQG